MQNPPLVTQIDTEDLDLEPLECDHHYELVSDEMGDPMLQGGWVDCSYMECSDCGATRDIEAEDLNAWHEEAARDHWNDLHDSLVDIMTPVGMHR